MALSASKPNILNPIKPTTAVSKDEKVEIEQMQPVINDDVDMVQPIDINDQPDIRVVVPEQPAIS